MLVRKLNPPELKMRDVIMRFGESENEVVGKYVEAGSGKIMRNAALVAVGAMETVVVREQEERKAKKKKKVRYLYGNTAETALLLDDET